MRIIYDVLRDGLPPIDDAASKLASARQQVGTGRRINTVSDDPLGAEQAIGQHTQLGALDAYTRTGDAAAARLAAADTVLGGLGDKLTQAIVTATSARGTTADPAARAAAAQAIRGLRDGIAADLNTQFDGTYLFSGTQAARQTYTQVGGVWTYQGDSHTSQLEVERGRLVSVSFDGQAIAKGADATDVLTTLDTLATAVANGDETTVGASLDAVNRAFDRTSQAQGKIGVDENEQTSAAARLSALRLATETRRSKIEDADLSTAVTQLQQADNAYRAALGAVSTAERLSLLDYLQ